MPVYEFRCEACGPFDAHHAMAQVPRLPGLPRVRRGRTARVLRRGPVPRELSPGTGN